MKGSIKEMGNYSPENLNNTKYGGMSLKLITDAISNKAPLEAKVVSCDKDNTLKLRLGQNIVGKIPFDELEYNIHGEETKRASAVSKISKYVRFIPLEIKQIDEVSYEVLCSRKMVQKDCFDNFISKLTPGDIIDAKPIKTLGYGTFCDIGCGIIALLPTNNISVTHVIDQENIFRNISRLKVIISSIDDHNRIQLSHKELLGTWEENVAAFEEQDITYGTVLSIEDYGIFVRLSQNLSGLAEPVAFKVEPGDLVSVRITNIKPDKMKVKLLILEKLGKNENDYTPFNYSIQSGHITDWVYSTESAPRRIESHFC